METSPFSGPSKQVVFFHTPFPTFLLGFFWKQTLEKGGFGDEDFDFGFQKMEWKWKILVALDSKKERMRWTSKGRCEFCQLQVKQLYFNSKIKGLSKKLKSKSAPKRFYNFWSVTSWNQVEAWFGKRDADNG